MPDVELVPYFPRHDPGCDAEDAARAFFETMRRRRSVRFFSDRPVSRETIEWVVRTAASAPSGANKQPWRFVCVSDPALKRRIRQAAEACERDFYGGRAGERWLRDLAPLGTDEDKHYLEVAPWLIAVFRLAQGDDGSAVYYGAESVGIAAGFLIAAIHHAGLSTLPHTPSPMAFLSEVLSRRRGERPFLLLPVGYAADDCVVPAAALAKKSLDEVMVVEEGSPAGRSDAPAAP